MIDTDAKNAISKIFVCLSVCMFLIETKTTRRILTKLGTIILHTPGKVIVYLGIPTGTGISGKILLYEKSKPRKIDEGGKTGSTRTKSRAAASNK